MKKQSGKNIIDAGRLLEKNKKGEQSADEGMFIPVIFNVEKYVIKLLKFIPLLIGMAFFKGALTFFYLADRMQGWPPEAMGSGIIGYFVFSVFFIIGIILCGITAFALQSVKLGLISIGIPFLLVIYISVLCHSYSLDDEHSTGVLPFHGDSKIFWSGIASSADGNTLAATVVDDCMYTSKNSGTSWSKISSSGCNDWRSITSSADGRRLAAVSFKQRLIENSGFIFTSTDSGSTWIKRTSAGRRDWKSITSSADGSKLAAAENDGYIYTSADSGAAWTKRTFAGSRYWNCITSSSDGRRLAVVENGGYIYTSADSGSTWTKRTSAGSRYWHAITSSADGSRLAAVENGGYIYTSSDCGSTWIECSSAESRHWRGITSSADGTRLAATALMENQNRETSCIYTSTDGGATWIERFFIEGGLGCITSSGDGMKVAVVGETGIFEPHRSVSTVCSIGRFIYTSHDGGITWTNRNTLPFFFCRLVT